MRLVSRSSICLAIFVLGGCSSSSSGGGDAPPAGQAGTGGGGAGGTSAGGGGSPAGGTGTGGAGGLAAAGSGGVGGGAAGSAPFADTTPTGTSAIRHVVLIVQENHTFDSYFGSYCTAPTGALPTCNDGPACCEAAPTTDPGTGMPPIALDDAANAAYDPNHTGDCELQEIDGGKMDKFISAPMGCGDARNFAVATAASAQPYWDLAAGGALADRYFQPIAGQSSANDMYFARASFVFADNGAEPSAIGSECAINGNPTSYTDKTIGDLLADANVPWAVYAEGYQAALDAHAMGAGNCAKKVAECKFPLSLYPCTYDPGDIPFEYYPRFTDNPAYMHDYAKLATDVAGSELPSFSFVKGYGFRSEHPGYKTTISAGATFVSDVIATIAASPYASSTLILVTYDEGGGYFDHVAPPPDNTADMKHYGTRVPMIAVGPFAKKNHISHVVMEHSSVVKFIEWNWLGGMTGQLGTRDANVANIGSLLDPAATVTAVPE